MRKPAIIFLGVMALTAAGTAHADLDDTFVTGRDWNQHMSQREKFMSLLPPTLLFDEYDVHLRHSLPQYIVWMDNILGHNPEFEREDVNSIFASTIFLFEPENRTALRTMETNFLRGDYESHTVEAPKLTIEEVLQEISSDS